LTQRDIVTAQSAKDSIVAIACQNCFTAQCTTLAIVAKYVRTIAQIDDIAAKPADDFIVIPARKSSIFTRARINNVVAKPATDQATVASTIKPVIACVACDRVITILPNTVSSPAFAPVVPRTMSLPIVAQTVQKFRIASMSPLSTLTDHVTVSRSI
tara:strand:+ start:2165 stop:2635 length:471 start_codon:yes stop_codon:yes gene_type:complete